VHEAVRLFGADFDRKPYTGGDKDMLVSPVNARERLTAFLKGAKQQLLVYDAGLSDNAMLRILQDRVKQGVEVRIIGKVEKGYDLSAERLPGKRQHVRCIVRDRRPAFVGSQSLRKLELDGRREIGVLVKEPKLVKAITSIFEADWAETDAGRKHSKQEAKREEKGADEKEHAVAATA
jgi:phosphatidylserine/phosphatidylglycerophosphate/cardiolipin synthase-like enzyme